MRSIRRTMRDNLKYRTERFEAKFHKDEEHVQEALKEKAHDVRIKREVRKLREEDFRQLTERIKRKDTLRKLYILEKDWEAKESVEVVKVERERLVAQNAERHRQQALERQALEQALAKLTHL